MRLQSAWRKVAAAMKRVDRLYMKAMQLQRTGVKFVLMAIYGYSKEKEKYQLLVDLQEDGGTTLERLEFEATTQDDILQILNQQIVRYPASVKKGKRQEPIVIDIECMEFAV